MLERLRSLKATTGALCTLVCVGYLSAGSVVGGSSMRGARGTDSTPACPWSAGALSLFDASSELMGSHSMVCPAHIGIKPAERMSSGAA